MNSLVEDPGSSCSMKFECACARDIHEQPLQAGTMYTNEYTRHTQASSMNEDPILTVVTASMRSHNSLPPLPECVQTDNYSEPPMSWSPTPESLKNNTHELNPLSPLLKGTSDNPDVSPLSTFSVNMLNSGDSENHLVRVMLASYI